MADKEIDLGVEDGQELPNEHGTEVVVIDKDEDGNVVGFHKELKKGK